MNAPRIMFPPRESASERIFRALKEFAKQEEAPSFMDLQMATGHHKNTIKRAIDRL